MESSSSKQASAPWRPRKYVLVGMGVILGMSALIVITSIILQPANIFFSATDFWLKAKGSSSNYVTVLGFNLTSHNPSHRAGLVYRYISVSVQLQHNGNPSVRKTSVPANVTNYGSEIQQERNSNKTMAVEASLDDQFYIFYSRNASATIMLYAQARFKVGLACTRLYIIRVRCQRVDLPPVGKGNHDLRIANCFEA